VVRASGKHRCLVAVVCAAAANGCSGDANGAKDAAPAATVPTRFTAEKQPATVPANIVTDDAAAKEKAGSPQRALLDWWQAVQFRDVRTARSLTSDAAVRRVGYTRFRKMVLGVGDGLPGLQIVNSRERGGATVVRSFLVFVGARGAPSTLAPRSFEMRGRRGSWRLGSIEYLSQSYGARNSDGEASSKTTSKPKRRATTTTP